MSTAEFTVTGMSCGHCENAVREELAEVPGITDIEVSAADGTLRVTSAAPVDEASVIAAVDEAGYGAVRS